MYKVSSRAINLYCFIFSGCLQLLLRAGEKQGRGKGSDVSQSEDRDRGGWPMRGQCAGWEGGDILWLERFGSNNE